MNEEEFIEKHKKEIEEWLDEHGFTYSFRKEHLIVEKIGIYWIIPYWELHYINMPIGEYLGKFVDSHDGAKITYTDEYGDVYAMPPKFPKWL